MTHITLPRATVEQALEAMGCAVPTGKITLADWHKSIAELEAVLAQQVKHVAWMHPWPPVRAQQAEPLTIERLRDALVASRIIPPAAVEDPDGYDDGVTLFRIEALHRRLT